MDIPVNIGQKLGIEGKAGAATDIIQPIIDYHVALETKNLESLRSSVYYQRVPRVLRTFGPLRRLGAVAASNARRHMPQLRTRIR